MVLITYDPDLIRKDPSNKYLLKQLKARTELILVCYQEEIRGVIEKIMKYGIKIKGIKPFNKTNILYCFKPDALEAVKKHVGVDEEVQDEKLEPMRKIADRLQIPDEVLQKCFEEKRNISITMRNGHVLKGKIHSFGIFSIRLQIDKKNRVIIFRHAIYDLEYRQKNASSK